MARTIVGLDIGSSAVRAVEVRTGRHPVVRRAGRVALSPGAVEGGQVLRPAEVTAAIKRLWHEQKFSTRSVRLGIGSGSVLVRQVEVDWMPPADLRKAMRFLVADLLPVPVDEANIDHILLGEVDRVDPANPTHARRMAKVLLVATAREGVDDTVRAVMAAGLRTTTADLSPLALIRAAATLNDHPTDPDSAPIEAVVDIGAEKVAVAVHQAGAPRFVRVIPGLGGATVTRALMENLGIESGEAEQLKRTTAQHANNLAAATIRTASTRMIEEVRQTLAFYTQSDAQRPPQRLVLTGLGSSLPGLVQTFATSLGIPAADLGGINAPAQSNDDRDSTDADLAVCFGLCLGAAA